MRELPPPVKVSPLIKFFRYAFLISGIVYGTVKLQALKALEHSRAGEKAKRKVEKEARLIEEARLASERDIQQMLEAFSPPKANIPQMPEDVKTDKPPVDTVQKPEETSSKSQLGAKGFAAPSDSKGESDYSTPFSKSSDLTEEIFFDKPLDLSGEDFVTNDENPENDENDENDYFQKTFKDVFD